MFFRSFLRTLRTLKSPHFLGLLVKSAVITLLAFCVFMALAAVSFRQLVFLEDTGLDFLLDMLLTFGAWIGGWFLLPVMLPAIAAFFQETIANRIEERDYPAFMPPAVERPWLVELWEESKFVLLLLALNLLMLPFIFFPVIYYGVNGYLIGREFFETVAARHIGKREAKKLRRTHNFAAFLGGLLIVLMTNIPFVQLISPFVGVALMVHLYHLLPKPEIILPAQRGIYG